MTPARRKALQYFARCPAGTTWLDRLAPSRPMMRRMIADGQLDEIKPDFGMIRWKITKKGLDELEASAT